MAFCRAATSASSPRWPCILISPVPPPASAWPPSPPPRPHRHRRPRRREPGPRAGRSIVAFSTWTSVLLFKRAIRTRIGPIPRLAQVKFGTVMTAMSVPAAVARAPGDWYGHSPGRRLPDQLCAGDDGDLAREVSAVDGEAAVWRDGELDQARTGRREEVASAAVVPRWPPVIGRAVRTTSRSTGVALMTVVSVVGRSSRSTTSGA